MDRDSIDEILIDGSKDEMHDLICPECNTSVSYEYSSEADSFVTKCKCTIERSNGLFHEPNCVEYFGKKHQF